MQRLKRVTDLNDKAQKDGRKSFFVDSSAMMLNPWAPFKLASCKVPDEIAEKYQSSTLRVFLDVLDEDSKDSSPNDVYIPEMVEWELNNIKDSSKDDGEKRFQASFAINVLTGIRRWGAERRMYLTDNGITLPNGARLCIVPHDEKKFSSENTAMYDPNRDDRLIYDVQTFIKGTRSVRLKRSNIQIVTEDHGLEGKVYDLEGELKQGVTAKPLLLERTRSDNPSLVYTGISKELVHLPDDIFNKIISDNSYKLSIIELNAILSKNLSKSISNLCENEYIEIAPENKEIQKEEQVYLRRKGSELIQMDFVDDFIHSKFFDIDRSKDERIKDAMNLQNLEGIKSYVQSANMRKDKRSQLLNKIRKYELMPGERALERLTKDLYVIAGLKKSPTEFMESRDGLLTRSFAPFFKVAPYQRFIADLLNDKEVALVSITGGAGTGKTLMAIASAFHQIEQEKYSRLIYIRAPVYAGEELGAVPGDLTRKMSTYMVPCEDQIKKLFGLDEIPSFYTRYPQYSNIPGDKFIAGLKNNHILQYDVITYLHGRTLTNAIIILDEAQFNNREQLRMIVGRVGEGSKLVLLGDYAQIPAASTQIIKKYSLTSRHIGISHYIEKVFIDRKTPYSALCGHITIPADTQPLRSQISGLQEFL